MNNREHAYQSYLEPILSSQLESFSNPKWGLNQILMFQLLQFQKLVNIELEKNQSCIDSYLSLKREQSDSKKGQSRTGSSSGGPDNSKKDHKTHNTISKITTQSLPNINGQQNLKNTLKRKKNSTMVQRQDKNIDSQYNPNEQNPSKARSVLNSESKNVPKNISKSILLFVMKKQTKLKKLMQDLEINKQQFMQQVASLKGKIHAIAQLRSLWLDSENKHAKIFRIISNYYLRKYSLQHIFNSRVVQYGKHLKYRQRILAVLKNPEIFTHMKQY